MFSILPCPKWWSGSAGLSEVRTENQAMTAARRSTPEWMASEITETDPMRSPTASFPPVRRVLDTTESRATRDFRNCWLLASGID